MNDKIQLAAMGEHMAEQAEQAAQPLCMAKRIDELEAQVRVMVGALNELREFAAANVWDDDERGALLASIDAALTGKQPEPVYYMNDNHTFKRLSNDVDTAITEIEAELDAGWTSGMLCSKRKGFSPLHANSRRPREEFISDCRDALLAASPKPEAK